MPPFDELVGQLNKRVGTHLSSARQHTWYIEAIYRTVHVSGAE